MAEENNGILQLGIEIASTLSELMPEKSLSFSLNEEGFEAVNWLVELTKEKMPKNMHVLKENAMEALTQITEGEAGTPLNVNFTEDELKALAKVQEIAEREVN
jgi:hypothetical protein